jgi:hypothetical protein
LIETPTTKETLVRLFYYLVEQFDADRFAGFTGVYQFYLAEDGATHDSYMARIPPHPVPLPPGERGPKREPHGRRRGDLKESPTAGGEGT